MPQVASQAQWFINSTAARAKQLKRVKSYDIADGSSVEAVTAVGVDDPVGFRDKPGPKTITFEVLVEQGAPEVDWQKLKTSKETFGLVKQIVNGQRVQYPECRVSTISPSGDDEGSHMISVEIVALREVAL